MLGAWAGVFAITGLGVPMRSLDVGQAVLPSATVQTRFGPAGWGGIVDESCREAYDASPGVEPMRFEIEFEPVPTGAAGLVLGGAADPEDSAEVAAAFAVGETDGE
ncbi:MAG: hypothetical protein AAF823_14110 [Planctomycetota bacterium]